MIKITYWDKEKQTIELNPTFFEQKEGVSIINDVKITGLSPKMAFLLKECAINKKGEAFYFPPSVKVMVNIKL